MAIKREIWKIEVGPVTRENLDGFCDVTYSIGYPRGTFSVTQRIRHDKLGYAEAHERIKRICESGSAPKSSPDKEGG